tara:strand:- start:1613 stop:1798 length:186 start_codon:yes stop_codon:yes gene_type:complete
MTTIIQKQQSIDVQALVLASIIRGGKVSPIALGLVTSDGKTVLQHAGLVKRIIEILNKDRN